MKFRVRGRNFIALFCVTFVWFLAPRNVYSGGFVTFGSVNIVDIEQLIIPVNLTFNGQIGLAGLQLKIVGTSGTLRLESVERGQRIANADAWGFDYSVTRGGDTMIVLLWSRTTGSLAEGTYSSLLNISVARTLSTGSSILTLTDVQSVLADGQGTAANIKIGSPPSIDVSARERKPSLLSQNFPNPCNPSTMIRYFVPEQGHITLKVYNSLGQEVRTVIEGEVDAGGGEVSLTLTDLPSGTYFYRLSGKGFEEIHKMMFLK